MLKLNVQTQTAGTAPGSDPATQRAASPAGRVREKRDGSASLVQKPPRLPPEVSGAGTGPLHRGARA